MSRDRGALALVLHTHMPYVEGFGTWPFGEEWLWEAVACVYLPLLEVLERGAGAGDARPDAGAARPARDAPGAAGERLAGSCATRAGGARRGLRGLDRTGQPELAAEVRRAAGDYERAAERLRAPGGRDLVGAPGARSSATRPVELWTSAATHAVLPLLATDAGLRLQLATGVASHERRFGGLGGGFWLPECAYAPGLERELADGGVTVICVDQTDVHGLGAPEQLEPVRTAAGVVAVPIDWQTVELVWDGRRLPDDRVLPRLPPPHQARPAPVEQRRRALPPGRRAPRWRASTRATSWRAASAPRRLLRGPRAARACCAARSTPSCSATGGTRASSGSRRCWPRPAAQGLELATGRRGLARSSRSSASSRASTWGTGKDSPTWDSPAVADLAFAARSAELRTVAAAAAGGAAPAALARAARELLALQASDWAFLITRELAADYPRAAAGGHSRLDAALAGSARLRGRQPDPALRNLAPDLDLAPLVAP